MSNPAAASANVDPAELRKFSDLAHVWWDPTGDFAPLHAINPLRLSWISARTSLKGARVLDVGCGGGILSESMAREGAEVTGIDLSEKALAVARLHGLESEVKVDYRLVSAEELAQTQADAYDVVTCMEMIEHVPDAAASVAACAALVRPGGTVFMSTINRNAKAYVFAVLGAEYVLKLLPRGTHDYAKFVKPAELAEFARRAGLTVREFVGLHYNPLSRRYWLAPNTDVNYIVALQKGS